MQTFYKNLTIFINDFTYQNISGILGGTELVHHASFLKIKLLSR